MIIPERNYRTFYYGLQLQVMGHVYLPTTETGMLYELERIFSVSLISILSKLTTLSKLSPFHHSFETR
jgi:hypothetical protein